MYLHNIYNNPGNKLNAVHYLRALTSAIPLNNPWIPVQNLGIGEAEFLGPVPIILRYDHILAPINTLPTISKRKGNVPTPEPELPYYGGALNFE